MAKNCVYAPDKGLSTFYKLKKELGYEKAWEIYGIAMNPKFKEDFKNTLSLDAEGVPSYSSLMSNSYIQKYIGEKSTRDILQKEFKPKEDTIQNYTDLLSDAYKFNTEHPNRNQFVALVESKDNQLIIKLLPKNKENDEKFRNQYASHELNNRLSSLLSPVAYITPGMLSQAEVQAGRIGVIDFSKAKEMADDTISMIRVANNMEGYEALSEEYSHLIIRALSNRPIVNRTLNSLTNDEPSLRQILGDQYEDTVQFHEGDMSKVAEEALGQLLRNNLKLEITRPSRSNTLLGRFINYIKSLFKRISLDSVQDAVNKADASMSQLAKDLLSEKTTIKKSEVAGMRREGMFNALSDRIERNISILTEAKNTQIKKHKITDDPDEKDRTEQRVDILRGYLNPTADTAEGILKYARLAVKDLNRASGNLARISSSTINDQFKILRGIRSSLQSYGGFIAAMNQAINEEQKEADNMFLRNITVGGETVTVEDTMKELNHIMNLVASEYMSVAKNKFAEFLKPFLGEEITIEMGKNKGQKVKVRDILDAVDSDISFMDRWLDAMGDSSDILLQAFDAIVKRAVDNARYATIKNIRKIQALRMKAESLGITNFDWMFETYDDGTKTGNYISEVNDEQFWRDYREKLDELDKKYGKNARGAQATLKIQEREAWLKTHAKIGLFGDISADPTLYRNKDFDRLTANQKTIREEFLKLKEELDDKLPADKTNLYRAIQIRKDGVQRFIDVASSPSTIMDSIKEHLKSEFLDSEDDDTIFGVKKGLTDFAGNEFMVLPVLYVNRLKKPDELSTDIFGTLMAYSDMSHRYEQIEKIIDPLEVGRSIITDKGRKVQKTRGGNQLVEEIQALGEKIIGGVYEPGGTNIEKRLQDFFECQIYGKYLKDQGTFNVLGYKVNVNKVVSKALNTGSVMQMGLNFLANLANVTTGVCMQNIEAVAGEFFNPKELAKADAMYMSLMTEYMSEIGARNKVSKLALIDEYFNIKGTFNKNLKMADQRRSWLKRIFGESVLFLGQECGDHWLYNRTALAMMLREKVKVGNDEVTLLDALEVVKNADGTAELKLKDNTTDKNGNPIDIDSDYMKQFARKMLHVNQSLFGVYNDEDANAANRVAVGRLIMQYRKWMKAQYNKRFMSAQQSLALDQWEEGYYRTLFRITNELARGKVQLASVWGQMSNHERANIRRALFEMAQCFAVWCLANLFEWPDDKKRPWAMKLAEYSAKRLNHELGNLTPSTQMVRESLKTLQSPAASLSMIKDVTNLISSTIDPRDWNNELKSGPYKGMSTFEKNLLKAPLPGITQYRQINKFVGEIDTSLQYYARPN